MRVVLSPFCKQRVACGQGNGQRLPDWAGTEAAAHALPVSSAHCPGALLYVHRFALPAL